MNFAEYLAEHVDLDEVTAKDWDRMRALVRKGSDGASVAKSIKDKVKAIDRYVAGLKLTDTELSSKLPFKGTFQAFGNRAIELGADYAEIKKAYDNANVKDADPSEWVPKVGKNPENRHETGYILSIGMLSLKTGKSRYFNVHEEWEDKSTTYEIWKLDTGKYRVVVTSGSKPTVDVGSTSDFNEDQTRRRLPGGELVDWGHGSDLSKMAKVYGSSISAYVYK